MPAIIESLNSHLIINPEFRANYVRLIGQVARFDAEAAAWMTSSEACRSANDYGRSCTDINTAFHWELTPQGHEFWAGLHQRMDASWGYVISEAFTNPLSRTPEFGARYSDLIARVRSIDRAAAEYLRTEAPLLRTFNETDDLSNAFTWSSTPQGYTYWDTMYNALVKVGDPSCRAEYALKARMATWPEPLTWRNDEMRISPEIDTLRGLINDYVKAHLREPDRIDILGDLALLVNLYSDMQFASSTSTHLRETMVARLPVLATFYEAWDKLGYEEHSHWKCALWQSFGAYAVRGLSPMTYSTANIQAAGALPWMPGYMMHVSLTDPLKVAYTKSVKDLVDNRQMITTPGRLIKKMYPYISERQIKGYAEAHLAEHTPIQIKVAKSAKDIIHAIGDGPSESCMSNRFYSGHCAESPWFKGHVHPAAVYGHDDEDPTWDTDIEVLYFEKRGEVKARVICNAVTKACARIYGDAAKLKPAIEAMGYKQQSEALVGARIRHIPNTKRSSTHIIPYVDAGTGSGGGYLYYKVEDAKHWVLTTKGMSTYRGYENGGYNLDNAYDHDDDEDYDEDYATCDCCGGQYSHDDMISTYNGDGDYVCNGCADEHYVYAISRRGDETLVRNDDAVQCESDSQWYHLSYLINNDVVEVDGDYYKIDDTVCIDDEYYLSDDCVALDDSSTDEEYALKDDAIRTHDGRWITKEESWDDAFTGAVYHDDDDEDENGGELLSIELLMAEFSTASFLDNLHSFMVIGNSLVMGDNAQRGAIQLPEYLLTFGAPAVMDLRDGRGNLLDDNLDDALDAAYDQLTDAQEVTEDDYPHAIAA